MCEIFYPPLHNHCGAWILTVWPPLPAYPPIPLPPTPQPPCQIMLILALRQIPSLSYIPQHFTKLLLLATSSRQLTKETNYFPCECFKFILGKKWGLGRIKSSFAKKESNFTHQLSHHASHHHRKPLCLEVIFSNKNTHDFAFHLGGTFQKCSAIIHRGNCSFQELGAKSFWYLSNCFTFSI